VARETSVLVAYASKYGSTRGVAERAAARLGGHGARGEVREVDLVDDVGAYDAAVLGDGVFDQSWIPEAAELVRRNLESLAAQPVWPSTETPRLTVPSRRIGPVGRAHAGANGLT
jgi:menaquinone-dependent protoporphyrinogen oxidase